MLFLFNTTIMPNEGTFENKKVSRDKAWEVIQNRPYTSALGHQGSADAFNALFPHLECAVNRIQATMQPGDEAIALKVIDRIAEGKILTLEALNETGFEFYHIKMIE